MTTFVAALHLPYTAFIPPKKLEDPQPKSQFSFPKQNNGECTPLNSYKPIGTIQIPSPLPELVNSTPYDATTPMPNLLHTLGHNTIDNTTPPLIPLATPNEELFFHVNSSDRTPLGSSSDPSTRRSTAKKPARLQPTPGILPSNKSGASDRLEDGGYFSMPTVTNTTRTGRRLSGNSDRSIRSIILREEEWKIGATDHGNGGLKNAVAAAITAGHPTEKTCVGTLGFGGSKLDESIKVGIEGSLRDEYNCLVAFPSDEDFEGHYHHYCKEVLWPVFHYQIPDHPKSKAFLDHSWKYFVAVNRAIADVLIKDFKRDDTVWVNDYHLLLVPQMLREALGPEAKVGFFLHVGFPSSEVFRCLAHRERLLEGMLGSTMIGFQTDEYARHFLTTCSRLLNVEARNDGIMLEPRFVKTITLPIGIDPLQLDKKRIESKVTEWSDALKMKYGGKRLLVARDKLDGVRGVRQKLLAYELFLKANPQWVGKVILIQVALTTTTIVELQSSVLDIVTRINCAYSTLEYQPVIYLHQDITYHQYIALLQHADALVVTSLRDGMNLTSHEFVYLQNEKHSPLILSEFTGTSTIFAGADLTVNPWDISRCADAILRALTMSAAEKELRWQKLYDAVTHRTASGWFSEFLQQLDSFWEEQQGRETSMIPRLSPRVLSNKYQASRKRMFLLDYEGTLVSWGSPNSNIITSPQRVLDIITDLLEDRINVVYIMSSRCAKDIEQVFHRVPRVGLIAEGGAYLRPFDKNRWVRLADEKLKWKATVKQILDYYVERTPGTYIEERDCSYIWHHEKAEDKYAASRQSGDCCNHVNDSCENFRVHAIPIAGGVVVESKDVSKIVACKKVISMAQDRNWHIDFLMVAGDSRDDEPVFEWTSKLAKEKNIKNLTTVRVGIGHTQANTTTTGVAGVITALQKLVGLGFNNEVI